MLLWLAKIIVFPVCFPFLIFIFVAETLFISVINLKRYAYDDEYLMEYNYELTKIWGELTFLCFDNMYGMED